MWWKAPVRRPEKFCQSDIHPCWHGPIKAIVADRLSGLMAVQSYGPGREGWSLHRPGNHNHPGVAVNGFYTTLDELRDAVPEFIKALVTFAIILLAGGVL